MRTAAYISPIPVRFPRVGRPARPRLPRTPLDIAVRARLARTLVGLVEVRRQADPASEPVVALSQTKLAELAGGSRQSVNAALAALAARGLIRLDGRRIVVTDLTGLRQRAGLAA